MKIIDADKTSKKIKEKFGAAILDYLDGLDIDSDDELDGADLVDRVLRQVVEQGVYLSKPPVKNSVDKIKGG